MGHLAAEAFIADKSGGGLGIQEFSHQLLCFPHSGLIFSFYPSSMWYVYLLDCADGDIYKGSAKNVTDRIEDNKKGRVDATKHKLPIELICFIAFSNNDVAFRFEKYLKSGSGRAFINKHFL